MNESTILNDGAIYAFNARCYVVDTHADLVIQPK